MQNKEIIPTIEGYISFKQCQEDIERLANMIATIDPIELKTKVTVQMHLGMLITSSKSILSLLEKYNDTKYINQKRG